MGKFLKWGRKKKRKGIKKRRKRKKWAKKGRKMIKRGYFFKFSSPLLIFLCASRAFEWGSFSSPSTRGGGIFSSFVKNIRP